jgi:vesicle-associated membrane protein 7
MNQQHDTILQIENEISATKDLMFDNINKVIERGDHLDDLVIISDDLHIQSSFFNKNAKKLRRKLCLKNCRLNFLIFFILFLVIWLLSSFFCGFDYKRC